MLGAARRQPDEPLGETDIEDGLPRCGGANGAQDLFGGGVNDPNTRQSTISLARKSTPGSCRLLGRVPRPSVPVPPSRRLQAPWIRIPPWWLRWWNWRADEASHDDPNHRQQESEDE
jgi:hypothetical protein